MNQPRAGAEKPLKGLFNVPRLPGPMDWESLALLRQVGALRVGYVGVVLTPVIAYAILIYNGMVDDPRWKVALPTTLFVTFLGSTFLAVGHLLNEVLCPKLVKLHGSIHRYQAYLAEFVTHEDAISRAGQAAEQLLAVNRLREELPKSIAQDDLDLIATEISKTVSEVRQQPSRAEPLVTDYRAEWVQANSKLLPVRWTIVTCYVTSAGIAGFIAIRQLVRVYLAAFP